MDVYTYSEARQRLAAVLEQSAKTGRVVIRRRDGSSFVITPASPTGSPLDVPCLNLCLEREEIVELVREGRSRTVRTSRTGR